MAATIAVEIYAPERKSLELIARDIVLPGESGVFTVQPGHTPLLAALVPGVAIADTPDSGVCYFAVSGGFAEVRDDRVLLLAKACERDEDIDAGRAESARARAEERIKDNNPDTDVRRVELALARAMARLQAHKRQDY